MGGYWEGCWRWEDIVADILGRDREDHFSQSLTLYKAYAIENPTEMLTYIHSAGCILGQLRLYLRYV